jgi:hypothetical protein
MRTVARTAAVIGLSVALGLAPAAAATSCPNEAFRKGRSADLPDCRAYELVTPKELGRTGDMTFEESRDKALPSSDGEHFALQTFAVYFEPGVSVGGTTAVFSRTSSGWSMKPVATRALADRTVSLGWFSPDLSQVGFVSFDSLTQAQSTLEVGPVGGPYSRAVSVSGSWREIQQTSFAGVNRGTDAVPALSDIVFQSLDHGLLPPGPERDAAEQTLPERPVLYELANGRLRLVNIDNKGTLLNPCGAVLGFSSADAGNALNAVSDDGSRVFFTAGAGVAEEVPGCATRALYMRVAGRETVEVSAPEGVAPASGAEVFYDGASRNGAKVFFTTAMALTPTAGAGFHLYQYDTEAKLGHRLTLIADEVAPEKQTVNPGVVVSDDGSAVYYHGTGVVATQGHTVAVSGIWRYDTVTRTKGFVATPRETEVSSESYYTTPEGEFLVFPSGSPGLPGPEVVGAHGLEEERRGAGRDQLYRYSAIDGRVVCASCGEGVPPAKGEVRVFEDSDGGFAIPDHPRTVISVSDDGRRVFFQTNAKLVAQDTNEDTSEEERAPAGVGAGSDVYEWEQVGTEEAPGVFCQAAVGCTHLISAGEAVGPERFLGASEEGRDVFFASAAQLVPGATPEFTNIYDARVDGGFPPPPTTAECTSCQGVGSPTPQFGAGGSLTFTGPGNAAVAAGNSATPPSKPKPAHRCKRGFKRGRHRRCVRSVSRKRGR